MLTRRYIETSVALVLTLLAGTGVSWGAFEVIGQAARPAGMGGAFTALADDPNAIWYNPSGLSRLERREITASYARLFPDLDAGPEIRLWVAGYAHPLRDRLTVGLGLSGLGAEMYEETVIVLSGGYALSERFSTGLNVKYMSWRADGYRDPDTGVQDNEHANSALSFDVGALCDLVRRDEVGIRLGLSIRDLMQPNLSESGGEGGEIPRNVQAGVFVDRPSYSVGVDVARRRSATRIRMGGEYRFEGAGEITLRCGGARFMGDAEGNELDGGMGLRVGNAVLDYAFFHSLDLTSVGATHTFSIGYRF